MEIQIMNISGLLLLNITLTFTLIAAISGVGVWIYAIHKEMKKRNGVGLWIN